MNNPLHIEVEGNGLPILCLHGHPGSSKTMSVFTKSLSKQYRTLSPDLRGYGKSKTQQPFQMADHIDDLDSIMEEHNIDQCLILGWSLGGILAMEMALRSPSRVSGLILIGTASHPRSDHPPVSLRDNLYTGIASLINWIKPAWRWNIETFGTRSLYRYLVQNHSDEVYQHLATEGISAYVQTTKYATQALYKAINAGYNRLQDLHHVQCPCLVLAGECDRHITAAASRETADYLPNAIHKEYPNVAHLFPWEIPNEVLRDISAWIETTHEQPKKTAHQ